MSRKCIKCGQTVGDEDVYCTSCGDLLEKAKNMSETVAKGEALPKGDINAPLSVGDYVFVGLILMIPIVNIIVFVIWVIDKHGNINRRNLAKAGLLYLGISVVLFIILGFGMVRAVKLDQQLYPEERYFDYDVESPDFDEWMQLPYDAEET